MAAPRVQGERGKGKGSGGGPGQASTDFQELKVRAVKVRAVKRHERDSSRYRFRPVSLSRSYRDSGLRSVTATLPKVE